MQPTESANTPDTIPESVRQAEADLELFVTKMRREGLHQCAIEAFSLYYHQLRAGKQGFIPEADISPINPDAIVDYSSTGSFKSNGEKLLSQTAVIKLNGGLGTTMGCSGPKSLIEIRPGLDFLAIALERTGKFADVAGSMPAFILMNSFHTEPQMRDALVRYRDRSDIRLHTFLQHKFPKVVASTFLPAEYPQHPQHEWNPPGHGDLYCALATSGTLKVLLEQNYRYAYISNIDNVGAVLDTGILGYIAENGIEFLMEVTDRTIADRKGGHVARHIDGHLVLRESAQCLPEDREAFGDISLHRFFNTNNLWIDLVALQKLLDRHHGIPDLPLICNRKNLDPVDPGTVVVYQLESAMGAALSLFESAAVLRVPRTRFIPVKSCEDLLLLQSDVFTITDNFSIESAAVSRGQLPEIRLDRAHYTTVDQLAEHFPAGAPSLRTCSHFTVEGDIVFGKNICIEGAVTISNRTGHTAHIPDNSRIDHDLVLH